MCVLLQFKKNNNTVSEVYLSRINEEKNICLLVYILLPLGGSIPKSRWKRREEKRKKRKKGRRERKEVRKQGKQTE